MTDFSKQNPTTIKVKSKTGPIRPSDKKHRRDMVRTLARLTVGGALLAMDALLNALPEEEAESIQPSPDRPQTRAALAPTAEWEAILRREPGKSTRYALIGLISASQTGLRKSRPILRRAGKAAESVMDLAFKPLRTGKIFAPVRDRYQKLVKRGEAEVTRWVELGRAEDERSRDLAQTTLNQLVDSSLDQLGDNPHVHVFIQEVIQEQSSGLVDEVIEEVRERTVTGDILLEYFICSLFRRSPRERLPAPASTVSQPAKAKGDSPKIQTLQGHYAGFVSRLFAFGIDLVILTICLMLISWFFTSVNWLFGLDSLWETILGFNTFISLKIVLVSLTTTLFVAGYPLLFWTLTGQTPGKTLMGLRVVSLDGNRISFWKSIRRLIGYFLAALLLSLGFLWILFDYRRQGLHDKVAGTGVIYAWAAHPDETFAREKVTPRLSS